MRSELGDSRCPRCRRDGGFYRLGATEEPTVSDDGELGEGLYYRLRCGCGLVFRVCMSFWPGAAGSAIWGAR